MLKTRHCSVEIAGVSLPQEGPQAGCMVEDECSVLENPGRDPPPPVAVFSGEHFTEDSPLPNSMEYFFLDIYLYRPHFGKA